MARLRFALLPLVLLAAPATATAAFTEAPVFTVEGRGASWQSTGVAGEVAIGTPTGVRTLRATRAGFAPAGEVRVGDGFELGAVTGEPTGAGAVAGTVDFGDSVAAVVRDPGGAWSAPLPVAPRQGWEPRSVIADVSGNGDAVVAWTEFRFNPEPQSRVRIARRAAGQAAFGPATVLVSGGRDVGNITLEVGATDTGETVAMWATEDTSAKGPARMSVTVAIAGGDLAFGAVRPLTEIDPNTGAAIDIARDGRVLVSYVDDGLVTLAERAPGGAFAAPVRLARATDPAGVTTMARLGAGGAAAIAWSGNLLGQTRMATRPGFGGFRAPATLLPAEPLPKDFDLFWVSPHLGSLFSYSGVLAGSRLVLTADRALLALTEPRKHAGVAFMGARLVDVPLAGGAVAGATAGGPLDPPSGPEPLRLEDGSPALIWASAVDDTKWTLHLATEGASRPAAGAPPTVRVGRPVRTTLKSAESLRLPVSCDGPCTVRGQIVGSDESEGSVTLDRAGDARLSILPYGGASAPRREGPVRVRLTYGAPNSLTPQTRTLTVRLKRAAEKLPRIVDLGAERRGDSVRVTWTLANPPGYALIYVSGSTRRDDRGNPIVVAIAEPEGRKQKNFRVTLRPAERVRYVTLRMFDETGGSSRRTVKVS